MTLHSGPSRRAGARRDPITLDRHGLVDAWLASRRRAPAHPGMRDFSARRYRALSGALGVDLDRFPDATHSGLALLFESTVRVIESARTPFSGFVEIDEQLVALASAHRRPMAAATADLVAQCRLLLEELVGVIWGLPAARTVSHTELRAHGFDPREREPKECDVR